jgi:hypothetical protein
MATDYHLYHNRAAGHHRADPHHCPLRGMSSGVRILATDCSQGCMPFARLQDLLNLCAIRYVDRYNVYRILLTGGRGRVFHINRFHMLHSSSDYCVATSALY